MKKFVFVILLLLWIISLKAQYFEGELSYLVSFEINEGLNISKDQILKTLKEKGEFYDTVKVSIKNGNYVKKQNSKNKAKFIYLSNNNKLYSFSNDSEYVTIIDATKFNSMNLSFPKPSIENKNSKVQVLGHNCEVLILNWDRIGQEQYYYNDSLLKVKAPLFKKHNYDYLNLILGETNASYPLMINKSINKFLNITLTLVEMKPQKINDNVFKLPEMKKAKKKDYDFILKTTGNEIMKIRN